MTRPAEDARRREGQKGLPADPTSSMNQRPPGRVVAIPGANRGAETGKATRETRANGPAMDDMKDQEGIRVPGDIDRAGTTRNGSPVVTEPTAKRATRAGLTGRTWNGRSGSSNLGVQPLPVARAVERGEESAVEGGARKGELAWSIRQVAASLDIGRRTLEREIAAGRFPRADFHIGKMPRWRPATVRAWVQSR
jgi:predicted DNA-binding transcriptional regulator AlpA